MSVEPKVGMLVACTRQDHPDVPYGMTGVIDLVDRKTSAFWVLLDSGGFLGWTSFASWEWSGKMLPRTDETEGWYAMREDVEKQQGNAE